MYIAKASIRWSDFDANGHMRHTVYADLCSAARLQCFYDYGIDIEALKKNSIGPLLFREETIYYREIRQNDEVVIHVFLTGLSEKAERWKMEHLMYKNKNVLAAKHLTYGAWLDLSSRKLGTLPQYAIDLLCSIERANHFEKIELKKK